MSALWLAMALLAADGGGLRFEGSVAAGGGYETNLLVAPGEEGLGSAVASLSATGGAAIDLTDWAFLYLGAALDSTRFATLSDLDRTAAGASASILVDLVGPLALVLGSTASHAWYADPARSGTSITVRTTLRYRPAPWLTTRLGYAHVLRTAADPVYGASFDRIFAEMEFQLARATWMSVATFVERGDLTFYREILPVASIATAASSTPGWTTTAAAGATYEPYRAPATTVGVGLGFEQGLGAGFSVDLGATWRRTDTPEGSYSGPSATASVAWRWE
jgi:hypothetical protein